MASYIKDDFTGHNIGKLIDSGATLVVFSSHSRSLDVISAKCKNVKTIKKIITLDKIGACDGLNHLLDN